MPKPKWLRDKEDGVVKYEHHYDMCDTCKYFGEFERYVRHKGKEPVELHRCSKHRACFNTKYSICCEDYERDVII